MFLLSVYMAESFDKISLGKVRRVDSVSFVIYMKKKNANETYYENWVFFRFVSGTIKPSIKFKKRIFSYKYVFLQLS